MYDFGFNGCSGNSLSQEGCYGVYGVGLWSILRIEMRYECPLRIVAGSQVGYGRKNGLGSHKSENCPRIFSIAACISNWAADWHSRADSGNLFAKYDCG